MVVRQKNGGKENSFMKKGQVYEGIIEAVDFPNKGRIHLPMEEISTIQFHRLIQRKCRPLTKPDPAQSILIN